MERSLALATAVLALAMGGCRATRGAHVEAPPELASASETTPATTAPEPAASTRYDEAPPAPAAPPPDDVPGLADPQVSAPPSPPRPPVAPRAPIDVHAPLVSSMQVLLVPKKLRRLSFAPHVVDILAPLSDFALLVDGGRLDVLHDFDHIVIANPDMRDGTKAFVVADHRLARAEVQRALERSAAADGQVIEWLDADGLPRGNPRPADPAQPDDDDRWLAFLADEVVFYGPAEYLPSLATKPIEGRPATVGEFVAACATPRRVAARHGDAALRLAIDGVPGLVIRELKIGGNPLPFALPDDMAYSISAAEAPTLAMRYAFAERSDAEMFVEWWTEDLRLLIESSLAVRLQAGWLHERLRPKREGTRVTLRGKLATEHVTLLLQFVAAASRKVTKRSFEEVEAMRLRRQEAWKARREGKLPPSAVESPTGAAKAPAVTGADPPSPPSEPPPIPPEPAKTPADPPANGGAPG